MWRRLRPKVLGRLAEVVLVIGLPFLRLRVFPAGILLWTALGGLPAISGSPVLTNIAAIRKLSRADVAQKPPILVRGVITLNAPDRYLTFVQDSTAGIYLNKANERGVAIETGDQVEVRGFAGPGLFAPVLNPVSIRVLGRGQLPQAEPVSPGELKTGALDSRFVEVSGVVRSFKYGPRSAKSKLTSVRLELLASAGRMTVLVLSPEGFDPERLIGATIEARGPIVVTTNQSGQLIEEYVATRSSKELRLLKPEQSDPWLAPPEPISGLLLFEASRPATGRVKVRGVVTLADSGNSVFLQNGSSGIELQSNQQLNFPLGADVEAVGFPTLGGYSPVLSDTRIRLLDTSHPVKPLFGDAESATAGKYEAQLVRMRAQIVAQIHDRERQVLWLQSGSYSFAAVLNGQVSRNEIDDWANGTAVELTGVCHTLLSEDLKEPVGFRILLRTTGDVRLVRVATWWTGTRLLQICGGAMLLCLVAVVWNLVLRRRVNRQTSQLRDCAIFEQDRSALLEMVGLHESLGSIFDRIRVVAERQLPGASCAVRLSGEQGVLADGANGWIVPIESADSGLLGTLQVQLPAGTATKPGDREQLGDLARLAGIAIEHRQLYDRLTRLSQVDTLSGLANRLVLENHLRQAIAQAERYQYSLACLYLDLDGFKRVNDTLGHSMGDLVIQTIAERIRRVVRESDLVARVGGDEFCIVLPQIGDNQEAWSLGDRLLESIREPMILDQELIYVSTSVGISYYPDDGNDAVTLQRNADAAMYRAKNSGKNRICQFGSRQLRAEQEADAPPALR